MARHPAQAKCIGILTSGGDCPGLNAAIRGVAKPALNECGMKVIGILDGFRGLVENRTMVLDDQAVSGILTHGGTILGTSRDKPRKMPVGNQVVDMTEVALYNYRQLHLDCLVCLGGGGTAKNAMHLHRTGGIHVITLPKTIDNDVVGTDISFGFDSAMAIATEAIDRLHTTATSHHRIMVCEIMGHNAGWLPLGSGIAGGADVILIPEIPYDLRSVAEHLMERRRSGKRFSIVAVAEGAVNAREAARGTASGAGPQKAAGAARAEARGGEGGDARKHAGGKGKHGGKAGHGAGGGNEGDAEVEMHAIVEPKASRVARELQALTGVEARVTSLGHVQRGGTPTATDRLLCTRLGVAAAKALAKGRYNVMIAVRGTECVPVPLEDVVGKRKTVPLDHPWIEAARRSGTCLGDK